MVDILDSEHFVEYDSPVNKVCTAYHTGEIRTWSGKSTVRLRSNMG